MVWSRSSTETLDVDQGAAWAVISDLPGWNRWDPDVVSIALHSPIEQGVRGDLVPTGRVRGAIHRRAARSFTITEYGAGSVVRMDQPIPLGMMTVRLALTPVENRRTTFTQSVELRGPFAPLLVRVIGQDLVDAFPQKCAQLVRLATWARPSV